MQSVRQQQEVQREFTIALRIRFYALENEDDDGEDQGIVETTWDNITKLYKEKAENQSKALERREISNGYQLGHGGKSTRREKLKSSC